jgi:Pyruvate/2-oxoacid:ferredoxin oxidoreductase delta subunit
MKLPDFLVKNSTQVYIREARSTDDYSIYDFLHGYVYARWPYLYIGIGTGEHPLAKTFIRWGRPLVNLFTSSNKNDKSNTDITIQTGSKPVETKTFADGYHGKVVPLESATQLVQVNENVKLPDLEQVIPYQRARDIILQNPDHIVVLECPCRSARENPCYPLDVCLIIGEPFAGFLIEHNPQRARWISSAEAADILRAEDERGHAHHAFFKDAMLDRFYAICNCCQCCCGAINSHRNGTPMLASSGYTATIDEVLCIGCGDCSQHCQFGAITTPNGTSIVDVEACMGCGICANKCDQDAITLLQDSAKGQPLEIFALIEKRFS